MGRLRWISDWFDGVRINIVTLINRQGSASFGLYPELAFLVDQDSDKVSVPLVLIFDHELDLCSDCDFTVSPIPENRVSFFRCFIFWCNHMSLLTLDENIGLSTVPYSSQ